MLRGGVRGGGKGGGAGGGRREAAAAMEPSAGREATISFQALQRARRTLQDFVLSYFPLHEECCVSGREGPWKKFWEEGVFETLVFAEATIYNMDEENEKLAAQGVRAEGYALRGEAALRAVLRERGLWDDDVEREISNGLRYWREERRLCALMRERKLGGDCGSSGSGSGLGGSTRAAGLAKRRRECQKAPCNQCLSDVHAASEAKSFDYRLLHTILHKLLGKPLSPTLMAACRCDEVLLDIADDLVDYEDDVHGGTFNILRAYCHLYGPEKAPSELAGRISRLEEELEAKVAMLSGRERGAYMRRRAEAFKDEPGGRCWEIPRAMAPEAEALLKSGTEGAGPADKGRTGRLDNEAV